MKVFVNPIFFVNISQGREVLYRKSLSNSGVKLWKSLIPLILITTIGAAIRILYLGNTFQSSDNAQLTVKIIVFPGWTWMLLENFGILINVIEELFVHVLSLFRESMTEFWWKLPIALIGTFQIPIVYLFLTKMKCNRRKALLGAALISVLPIHVFQSRFLYGYEILGALFISVAIWKLIDFFKQPSTKKALIASLFLGLYLISHIYIVPFIFVFFMVIFLYSRPQSESPKGKPGNKFGVKTLNFLNILFEGLKVTVVRLVWLFPVLFFPLYIFALARTRSKPTRLGFYLFDHLKGFIANLGLPIFIIFILSLILFLVLQNTRTRESKLLLFCAFIYLAPLLFGTPHKVTVVRGYMTMSCYFIVLFLIVVINKWRWKPAFSLLLLVFIMTLYGTVTVLFDIQPRMDVKIIGERGMIEDPGTKAAAYLIHEYEHPSWEILSINHYIEPPNLFYYFRKVDYSFYDYPYLGEPDDLAMKEFYDLKEEIDVVIANKWQARIIEADDTFGKRIIICGTVYSQERKSYLDELMLLYFKSNINLPISIGSPQLKAIDKKYKDYLKSSEEIPTVLIDQEKRKELNKFFDQKYSFKFSEIFNQNQAYIRKRYDPLVERRKNVLFFRFLPEDFYKRY